MGGCGYALALDIKAAHFGHAVIGGCLHIVYNALSCSVFGGIYGCKCYIDGFLEGNAVLVCKFACKCQVVCFANGEILEEWYSEESVCGAGLRVCHFALVEADVVTLAVGACDLLEDGCHIGYQVKAKFDGGI